MQPLKTLALAVIASVASTAFAHGDDHAAKRQAYDASKVEERAFARDGDPRKVTRTVRVEMTGAFRFTPAAVTVKRGETVKFAAEKVNGAITVRSIEPAAR